MHIYVFPVSQPILSPHWFYPLQWLAAQRGQTSGPHRGVRHVHRLERAKAHRVPWLRQKSVGFLVGSWCHILQHCKKMDYPQLLCFFGWGSWNHQSGIVDGWLGDISPSYWWWFGFIGDQRETLKDVMTRHCRLQRWPCVRLIKHTKDPALVKLVRDMIQEHSTVACLLCKYMGGDP